MGGMVQERVQSHLRRLLTRGQGKAFECRAPAAQVRGKIQRISFQAGRRGGKCSDPRRRVRHRTFGTGTMEGAREGRIDAICPA